MRMFRRVKSAVWFDSAHHDSLRLLPTCLFLLLSFTTSAQQAKSFTEDPVKFISEVKDFFQSGATDKEECAKFMDKFEDAWKQGRINDEVKRVAYDFSNQILKKRLRATELRPFLGAIYNYGVQGRSGIAQWQECLTKVMNGKAIKNVTDFLNMSESLFESNTFYKSPTFSWAASNANYQFMCDSVPRIYFPNANIRCFNIQADSAVIYNTKGTYYPAQGKFVGVGGKVDWVRTGLEAGVAYAELRNYTVIAKSGGYTADTVNFYHKQYFQQALLGQLTEKVISEKAENVSYPRFESYVKRLKLNNLYPGVDYDGGFSMRGAKFLAAGSKEEPARIIFKRNSKNFLIASAKSFTIEKTRIASDPAEVKIMLEGDSIYHPGISFKYLVNDKHVLLYRAEEGLAKTPVSDSYHKLDMYFEEMSWKVEEPKVDFRMLVGNSQGEADFESADYYKQERYDYLQGMDQIHPLILVKDYVKFLNGGRQPYDTCTTCIWEFRGDAFAGFLKQTNTMVQPMLVKIASMGFITYIFDEDRVIVKPRLIRYILNRAGKADYDMINFHSDVKGDRIAQDAGNNNASINLLNNDLTIFGVKSILMSDSQQVVIVPKDHKVVVKKGRDFTFAGLVHAGRFDFFGKEFKFEYDKFKVILDNVDSLRLKVTSIEPDANGEHPLVRVRTVIENINGDLLIDHPKNKSGYKMFSQYPIFNSNKESFAYYDKRQIFNSVYKKDKVYFKLEPFTIDSLDNFTNTGLKFNGTFASAGIFPDLKETLGLMPDYSLGFVHKAPEGGYPLYGGKAVFKNEIRMSNEGLRGDGVVNFVTSTTVSKDFQYFPDSMNTVAQTFVVKEQKIKPEFPEVNAEEPYIHWEPKKNQMNIYKQKKPINCMNGNAQMNGVLTLTPTQLTGNGMIEFANSELVSKRIRFKSIQFDADTCDFKMKSSGAAALAFASKNVKAHIDFDKRTGEFESNGRGSFVSFPVNKYICYIDKFKWYMDKNDIEISAGNKLNAQQQKGDVELSGGSEFISTHPKQDSLRWIAQAAKVDLNNFIISARQVKFISVADAKIMPDSGNVVVEKDAKMRTLKNAKILANSVTKYHNVYGATIDITSRKNYSGSGDYDYIDEMRAKHPIHFSNISVDTTLQTFAMTEIPDSVKFTLSPNFDYKGKVKLLASNQFLEFTGAARIHHNCDKISKGWFKFSSQIDPMKIYIPISKELEGLDGKIASSVMVTTDSTHLYSAFLSPKKGRTDVEVLPADGFIYFEKLAQEYRISNKEKLAERALTGNYLSLNTKSCTVYGEGKMNLGTNLGQVSTTTVGSVNHFLIPDSTAFDLLMGINFFFDDGAIDKMANDIGVYFTNLTPTNFSRPVYEKGLRELLGKEQADKLISQVNLYGSFKKFPDELKYTLFLTDLKMKWTTKTSSYLSRGKIGIGNIQKTQINKFVDGRIEIKRKRSGDIITIYLEMDPNNWYFFTYERGLMQAVSSNANFNNIIKEMKPENRKHEEKDKPAYQFNLCTEAKKKTFLRKVGSVEEEEKEEEGGR